MIHEANSSALCDMPTEQGTLEVGYPRVHVNQDAEALTLYVDLVGTREEDLTVKVRDHCLVIAGMTRSGEDIHEPEYFDASATYSYRRSFVLPPGIDEGRITSRFANGSLAVACPRTF